MRIQDHIEAMIDEDDELYELILETPGFAYHFNEMVDKAIRLERAYEVPSSYYGNHREHFERTRQGGKRCPECLRYREIRSRATQLFRGE